MFQAIYGRYLYLTTLVSFVYGKSYWKCLRHWNNSSDLRRWFIISDTSAISLSWKALHPTQNHVPFTTIFASSIDFEIWIINYTGSLFLRSLSRRIVFLLLNFKLNFVNRSKLDLQKAKMYQKCPYHNKSL